MIDLSNGPAIVTLMVIIIMFCLSIVYMTGNGINLIPIYSMMSQKNKNKYNEKKLCKITGFTFLVISFILLILLLFVNRMPISVCYILTGLIVVDILFSVYFCHNFCKQDSQK